MRLTKAAYWLPITLISSIGCGDNLKAPPDATLTEFDARQPPNDAPVPDAPVPDAPIPDAPIPDAPVPDASIPDAMPLPDADLRPVECAGAELPPPEGTRVTLAGETYTFTPTGRLPVPGVRLRAYVANSTSAPVASVLSDINGSYSMTINNGGVALDAYIRSAYAQFLDTYRYPAAPLYQQRVDGYDVPLLSQSQLASLAAQVGITQDSQNGIMIVTVVGCDGQPLAGATVTTDPPVSEIFYIANGQPSSTATMTATDGVAILFNVAPGRVVVDAEYAGYSLREHAVPVASQSITATDVRP